MSVEIRILGDFQALWSNRHTAMIKDMLERRDFSGLFEVEGRGVSASPETAEKGGIKIARLVPWDRRAGSAVMDLRVQIPGCVERLSVHLRVPRRYDNQVYTKHDFYEKLCSTATALPPTPLEGGGSDGKLQTQGMGGEKMKESSGITLNIRGAKANLFGREESDLLLDLLNRVSFSGMKLAGELTVVVGSKIKGSSLTKGIRISGIDGESVAVTIQCRDNGSRCKVKIITPALMRSTGADAGVFYDVLEDACKSYYGSVAPTEVLVKEEEEIPVQPVLSVEPPANDLDPDLVVLLLVDLESKGSAGQNGSRSWSKEVFESIFADLGTERERYADHLFSQGFVVKHKVPGHGRRYSITEAGFRLIAPHVVRPIAPVPTVATPENLDVEQLAGLVKRLRQASDSLERSRRDLAQISEEDRKLRHEDRHLEVELARIKGRRTVIANDLSQNVERRRVLEQAINDQEMDAARFEAIKSLIAE